MKRVSFLLAAVLGFSLVGIFAFESRAQGPMDKGHMGHGMMGQGHMCNMMGGNSAKMVHDCCQMKDTELSEMLKSEKAENRFAAAIAIGEKRLPLTEDLIGILTDKNDLVRQASRRSLILVSYNVDVLKKAGQRGAIARPVDFGPAANANLTGQNKAVKAWKQWATKNEKSLTKLQEMAGIGANKGSTVPPAISDKDAAISKALGKLNKADRTLAEAQKLCPVSGERLGSMGVPARVMIQAQPVLLCCGGCNEPALANPKQTLSKVAELKGKFKGSKK